MSQTNYQIWLRMLDLCESLLKTSRFAREINNAAIAALVEEGFPHEDGGIGITMTDSGKRYTECASVIAWHAKEAGTQETPMRTNATQPDAQGEQSHRVPHKQEPDRAPTLHMDTTGVTEKQDEPGSDVHNSQSDKAPSREPVKTTTSKTRLSLGDIENISEQAKAKAQAPLQEIFVEMPGIDTEPEGCRVELFEGGLKYSDLRLDYYAIVYKAPDERQKVRQAELVVAPLYAKSDDYIRAVAWLSADGQETTAVGQKGDGHVDICAGGLTAAVQLTYENGRFVSECTLYYDGKFVEDAKIHLLTESSGTGHLALKDDESDTVIHVLPLMKKNEEGGSGETSFVFVIEQGGVFADCGSNTGGLPASITVGRESYRLHARWMDDVLYAAVKED